MMKKSAAQNQKTNLFWRIFITAVGIAMILIAVGNFALYFFGETAFAQVTTRRVGGANDGRAANQRYQWSLDYTFSDKNGTSYNGTTTRRGNDLSVETESKVYYFPFAPLFNALEREAEPNLGQLALAMIGAFLLFVINKEGKISRHRKADDKSDTSYEPDGGNP